MLNLKDILQQAQGMQQRIAAIQEELAEKTVVGSAGGDMVKVEANGAQEILSVKMEDNLLSSGDKEVVEELIAAAVNDALRKARDLAAQEIGKLTGGLPIPGLGAR
jgi:DNA-binding YbaB/EbfC family protein